jgi:hypothetical protein
VVVTVDYTDLLNSNGLRVTAYLAASFVCALAFWRERNDRRRTFLWPSFWLLTAILFLAMGVARSSDLPSLVTEAGRSEAARTGWYESRRPLQALVVMLVSGCWLVTVVVAIWRVPERRRRYLPTAVMAFTLICFAAIRAVSLHHVDQVLYNRPVHGVRIAALLELAGLAVATATVGVALAAGLDPPARAQPRPPSQHDPARAAATREH